MRKKALIVVVLLGFLFVLTPLSYSAPKKDAKFTFSILIKKPVAWMSSIYDLFADYFGKRTADPGNGLIPDESGTKVKPLGDSVSLRPSKND